jgi:hypothetical protein
MTRQKQHIVKSERFGERGSRDQNQAKSVVCLTATPQAFGRETEFCKIAPVASCERLIARSDRSAKESASARANGQALERRIRATLQAGQTCGARSIACTRASKEKRQPSKPLELVMRSEPNSVTVGVKRRNFLIGDRGPVHLAKKREPSVKSWAENQAVFPAALFARWQSSATYGRPSASCKITQAVCESIAATNSVDNPP